MIYTQNNPTSYKRIAHSFSKYANGYDAWASVQKTFNEKLLDWAKLHIKALPSPLMDWGCGTGDLSEKLIRDFKTEAVTLSDISAEMVEVARSKISKITQNAEFKVCDAMAYDEWDNFRTVCSGLALQWVTEPYLLLKKIHQTRKPGDVILMSWFNEDCFPEWKNACIRNGIPFTGHSMPNPDFFHALALEEDALSFDLRHESFKIPVTYPTVRGFFKSMKNIGAGLGNGNQMSFSEYRKLESELQNEQGCQITWVADFVLITYS